MTAFSDPSAALVGTDIRLTDREVLTRLIDYARLEAEREGEHACADFLAAALLSLHVNCPDPAGWERAHGGPFTC